MVAEVGDAAPRVIDVLDYQVLVHAGVLQHVGDIAQRVAPARTFVVITDDNVRSLAAASVAASLGRSVPTARVVVLDFPAGEGAKSRALWASLTDQMLAERCGRDTTVIAVGGGVVGDLAGFVAATYMRGVPLIQVPTTLLAMVDASVGGKVGVDTPHGKNLVGAFHQPRVVVVDPEVLATLPPAHRRTGMAEVIKHGVIADTTYWQRAINIGPRITSEPNRLNWSDPVVRDLIADSVAIKGRVVALDVAEQGIRRTLNFGHTVGHAIEASTDFEVLHGDAVAIGMLYEARIAQHLGVTTEDVATPLAHALQSCGFSLERPADVTTTALIARMMLDKKNQGGHIVMSLPTRLGAMADEPAGFATRVPVEVIAACLDAPTQP